MSTLNDRIKNRRKELGLTQKELADVLSISDKTVSRWESGNQMPDAILLPDLAQALNITINDLYGMEDNIENKNSNNTTPTKKSIQKLRTNSIYKIITIVSILIVHFGACWLIHCPSYLDENQSARTRGLVIFLIGCIFLIINEIVFLIKNRNSNFTQFISTEVVFNGFSTIFISYILLTLFPLFHSFSLTYTYEIISVGIVILFIFSMLIKRKKLLKHGLSANRKTTITIILCAISIVIILTIWLLFNIVFNNTNFLHFEHIINTTYGASVYRIEYLVNFCSLFVVSIFLYLSLIINYIELINKTNKLNQIK